MPIKSSLEETEAIGTVIAKSYVRKMGSAPSRLRARVGVPLEEKDRHAEKNMTKKKPPDKE